MKEQTLKSGARISNNCGIMGRAMGWTARIPAVRDFGQKVLGRRSQALIKEHWPQQEKVGTAALSRAENNFRMEFQSCLSHRRQLLPAVNPTANPART